MVLQLYLFILFIANIYAQNSGSGECPETDPDCLGPVPCVPGIDGCPDGGLPCDPDAPSCKVDGGFTNWSAFGSCSKTCGVGIEVRTRTCTNPTPKGDGKPCVGANKETRQCQNETPCPVDGGFTPWSKFGPCSKTCGGGYQVSQRFCTNPKPEHGGNPCKESKFRTRACSNDDCPKPVNGGFTPWSTFGKCSKKCGSGIQARTRSCTNPPPAHGGKTCTGELIDVRKCNKQHCPINGNWGAWGAYDTCSVTCGGGIYKRNRKCDNPPPKYGGSDCSGSSTHTGSCNKHNCPINGNWGKWGDFGLCSSSCGGGHRQKSRKCNSPTPKYGGRPCQGSNVYSEKCNTHHCPVNGNWGAWSEYQICSKPCGTGAQKRYRKCNNPPPSNGGRKCEGHSEYVRSCNVHQCPVNGNWGKFGEYGACTKSCGGGVKRRFRQCNNPTPIHGGKTCVGSNEQYRSCNTHHCPVDGGFTTWSKFGKCSKSCGSGQQKRTRTCTNPKPMHGGKKCSGSDTHIKVCNTHKCPVDGNWGKWEPFGKCSVSCGNGGVQIRLRKCNNPPPSNRGRTCTGSDRDVQKCNTHHCPVNGNWNTWGEFGACSETCGGGYHRRQRQCNNPPPQHGGSKCTGSDTYVATCNVHSCPVNGNWGKFGEYGACTKSCGGGVQRRFRQCNNPTPIHGGKTCVGSNEQYRGCNTHHCPVDGGFTTWSKFGSCSKSCGSGQQKRTRKCTNPRPMHGGKKCSGSNTHIKVCNIHKCPINGNWGDWVPVGKCSALCDGGIQEKRRRCNNPSPANGGRTCVGKDKDIHKCNTHHCPVNGNWNTWGEFGPCSQNCNSGIRKKYRKCNNPAPRYGGSKCQGSDTFIGLCNVHKCPVHGNWGDWLPYGACTKSCNGGIQRSFRKCDNPIPQHHGRLCVGHNERVRTCANIVC